MQMFNPGLVLIIFFAMVYSPPTAAESPPAKSQFSTAQQAAMVNYWVARFDATGSDSAELPSLDNLKSRAEIRFPQSYVLPLSARSDRRAEIWSVRSVFPIAGRHSNSSASAFVAFDFRISTLNSDDLSSRTSVKNSSSDWEFQSLFALGRSLEDGVKGSYQNMGEVSRGALGLAGTKIIDENLQLWVNANNVSMRPLPGDGNSACRLQVDFDGHVENQTINASYKSSACPHALSGLIGQTFSSVGGFSQLMHAELDIPGQKKLLTGVAWLERVWLESPWVSGSGLKEVTGDITGASSPVVLDQFIFPVPESTGRRLMFQYGPSGGTGKTSNSNQENSHETWLRLVSLRRKDNSGKPLLSGVLYQGSRARAIDYRDVKFIALQTDDAGSEKYANRWRMDFIESGVSLDIAWVSQPGASAASVVGRRTGVLNVRPAEKSGIGETDLSTLSSLAQDQLSWFGFADLAVVQK